jgi:hypothetical protein
MGLLVALDDAACCARLGRGATALATALAPMSAEAFRKRRLDINPSSEKPMPGTVTAPRSRCQLDYRRPTSSVKNRQCGELL